jgi:enediyne biosynthesis protein E7
MYAALKGDLIACLGRVQREAGDFVRVPLPFRAFYLVTDPKLMREALAKKSDELILHGGAAGSLARLIGHGTFTNPDEDCRRNRTTPHLLPGGYDPDEAAKIVRRLTAETIARWRTRPASTALPLNRELVALSCRILYAVLFDQPLSFAQAEQFADAMAVLQSDGMARYIGGTEVFSFVPTPTNRRIRQSRATLIRLAEIVQGRHGLAVDHINSLAFAGTEGPANTLGWALWLLQHHPEWRDRLRQTAEPALGLDQVLSETLRLFPPSWIFTRYAVRESTLGGERLPRGSRLLFSPFLLHRNPRYWPDPRKFDPLRFCGAMSPQAPASRGAYLPFGADVASSIGSRLGWLQMQIILAELSQAAEWTIEDNPAEPLFPVGSFKLRPSFPMKATLHWRSPMAVPYSDEHTAQRCRNASVGDRRDARHAG